MERFIKYANIFVDRRGNTPDAFMRTIEIISDVSPNKRYVVTPITLIETVRGPKPDCDRGDPERVEITGNWNHVESGPDSDSNILGGLGKLTVTNEKIKIPVAETTDENLAFYGAKLLTIGDVIEFDTPCSLPVTVMEIGDEYVDNYIMTKAGGVYLELHDRPHFHMPVNHNCGGYLILGRQEGKYQYVLSAFEIPFGSAIYTSPYVIHNDCFLTGEYQVVYSVTNRYSTVRVLNPNNIPVKFEIEKVKK